MSNSGHLTAFGLQIHADIRERQTAMEAAVAAEDYVAAAAERDMVDALMLRRRKLEVLASVDARKVKYRPGGCAGLVAAVSGRPCQMDCLSLAHLLSGLTRHHGMVAALQQPAFRDLSC